MNSNIPKVIAGVGLLLAGFFVSQAVSTGKPKNSSNPKYLDDEGAINPDFNAKQIATDIHEIMRKVNWTNGDKNQIILTAFTGLSQTQFAQVVKAFGLRAYNTITGNDYQIIGFSLKKYPLKFWLKEEMSTADYLLLKDKFKKYL